MKLFSFAAHRILLAAAGFALVATDAAAQADPTPVQAPGGVGPTKREEPGVRTPSSEAASYEPKGMPVGSFRLFPQLELDEAYNSNVYATQTGQVGSFIQYIKPTLDLRSDWSRHMLNFYGKGNFGLYSVDSMNNFFDYGFGSTGRYDITDRDWNVYGGASFNHAHEDRGSPNSTATAGQPVTTYNQISANGGYFQRFNRLSVRLDGRLDNYAYLNPGLGPSAGSIYNFDRNRTEYRESMRVGYEFSPGFEVWTRGTINQRRYFYFVDTQGFAHDSNGYDVVGGVAVDLGGITSFEAFAGYLQQIYYDPRYPQVAAPTFGLIGYWNPLRELSIRPFVQRTVQESSLTSTSAYLSTAMGVDAEYAFRPNIKALGHFDYSIADYNAVSGTSNRLDQYFTFRADVTYMLTENFFIGPRYQYLNRVSNVSGSSYDQNLIMLRLGTRF
jgi:hypothetical protein